MNIWFRSNLGDAMLAGESLDHIKRIYAAKCNNLENSNEMAIFYRHESAGRMHCEVIVYFAPATASVAKLVDATPCKKPSVDSLDLLVGLEESWLVLFPEMADLGL